MGQVNFGLGGSYWRDVKDRWSVPFSFMRPSILEYPYRLGGGILEAISWLQLSALTSPGFNANDEEYDFRLGELHDAVEAALMRFDEFRSVYRSQPLTGLADEDVRPDNYDPFGRIPASIHKDVTTICRRVYATSRYDQTGSPSVPELKNAAAFSCHPLRDVHWASIGSMVCGFRAINTLTRILDSRTRKDAQNYADIEIESRWHAYLWIERAGLWIAHANQIERFATVVKTAKEQAAQGGFARAEQEAREARSNAAKSSQRSRRLEKAKRKTEIKKAWDSLPPIQRGRDGVSIVAKRLEISERTVRRYLKEMPKSE